MAEIRNIICLVVDRLQPALLGAYGNTWIETPHLNRLAAESLLCDQAVADSLDLATLYRGFWNGLPAAWPQDNHATISLPERAAKAGLHTTLLTDEPVIDGLASATAFQERSLITDKDATQLADEIAETQAARFTATISQWLDRAPPHFLLWVHARGLAAPWDAPYELRAKYADEEDPPPPSFCQPPSLSLPDDPDPDELLGILHAYAGQVSLWDTCIGLLIDQLRSSPLADNTLLAFISARGFPLGEHGTVGPIDATLYSENTQLAWMLRFPAGLGSTAGLGSAAELGWAAGLGSAARTQALTIPADLPATLADWCGWTPSENFGGGQSLMPLAKGLATSSRSYVVMSASDPQTGMKEEALRTPAWLLRSKSAEGITQTALFAKPSDRFEVNDVGSRMPEVVTELQEVLQSAQASPRTEITDLPRALVTEVD